MRFLKFCISTSFLLPAAMPMGAMPVLDIDGKRVHQSVAMTRFLAKEVGLVGENSWQDMEIDIIVDIIKDFLSSKLIF